MTVSIVYSLVIPVFRNARSLPELLREIDGIAARLDGALQVVFVVDGSPDDSSGILRTALPTFGHPARLISLSRNFGSFSAIRSGLECASGEYFAIMAADLQDPPEFVTDAFRLLRSGTADIVVGTRASRDDPFLSRLFSAMFWGLYRALIVRDIPVGGVDVFACDRDVRDVLVRFNETHTSLIGLLFWVGFRRSFVPYHRRPRPHGESAWSFRRKFQYMLDSVYAFTDLPIVLLTWTGLFGVAASCMIAMIVLCAWALGLILVPGYTPIVLSISFFGALNLLALGIVGTYVWRTYENTKGRPPVVVMLDETYGPTE